MIKLMGIMNVVGLHFFTHIFKDINILIFSLLSYLFFFSFAIFKTEIEKKIEEEDKSIWPTFEVVQ